VELFDIVDEHGMPTGQTVERSEAHAKGIRHRTAHIWVVREQEGKIQLLLQKRAQGKDSFPGCWDTSSAGHIDAGDEPLPSAIRELREELGIRALETDLKFIGNFVIQYEKIFYGRPFRDNEITFVYVYEQPVDVNDLVLQTEEVEDAAWFDISNVQKLMGPPRDPSICVPQESFAMIKSWMENR